MVGHKKANKIKSNPFGEKSPDGLIFFSLSLVCTIGRKQLLLLTLVVMSPAALRLVQTAANLLQPATFADCCIENKFTRTRACNFSCPLFSNGRDGSSLDLGDEKQMSTKVILCHRDIFTYYNLIIDI